MFRAIKYAPIPRWIELLRFGFTDWALGHSWQSC
jgi:hypothetical protein